MGEPNDEGDGTSTNQDHTPHDHSQADVIAVAIIALADEYRTRDEENQRQQGKTNRWVKAGTIFVALYTAITFYQLRATWDALDRAERASHLDQRAWVNVGRTIRPSEIKAGVSQVESIGMEFINSGKTQALDVNTVIAAQTLLTNIPFSPLYKGEARDSRTNLRPGVPFSVKVPNVTLRQEQIDAIRNGTLIFYVYGEISYEDIFANHHCTKFCLSFSPDLKGTGFCGVYNEMVDTECEYTK